VKNIDISKCIREKEYYLYVKYSDKDITEIIITDKDEHTYLLAKGFICLFDLTDFMTNGLPISDVVLDVEKSGFLKSKRWLELNYENLNNIFSESLKFFLQQNIPKLLTNKTYQYERGLLYTYPPLSVVFDEKNKNIFDIDDVLEIVDVVSRDNNYWRDFSKRDKSDFDKHSTYLLIDLFQRNKQMPVLHQKILQLKQLTMPYFSFG